jgi:hypothetical protein
MASRCTAQPGYLRSRGELPPTSRFGFSFPSRALNVNVSLNDARRRPKKIKARWPVVDVGWSVVTTSVLLLLISGVASQTSMPTAAPVGPPTVAVYNSMNDTTACTSDGITLDGIDDYLEITPDFTLSGDSTVSMRIMYTEGGTSQSLFEFGRGNFPRQAMHFPEPQEL